MRGDSVQAVAFIDDEVRGVLMVIDSDAADCQPVILDVVLSVHS